MDSELLGQYIFMLLSLRRVQKNTTLAHLSRSICQFPSNKIPVYDVLNCVNCHTACHSHTASLYSTSVLACLCHIFACTLLTTKENALFCGARADNPSPCCNTAAPSVNCFPEKISFTFFFSFNCTPCPILVPCDLCGVLCSTEFTLAIALATLHCIACCKVLNFFVHHRPNLTILNITLCEESCAVCINL